MNSRKAKFATLLIAFLMTCGAWTSALAIGVGDKAPDFELESTRGDKVKLSNLRGKTILLSFYVLDFNAT